MRSGNIINNLAQGKPSIFYHFADHVGRKFKDEDDNNNKPESLVPFHPTSCESTDESNARTADPWKLSEKKKKNH